MNSRLDTVRNSAEVVRKAGYHADTLAGLLRISPHQLRLYLLSRSKLSTKRWMEKHRMQDARRFLKDGKRIKEIAHLLGFRHNTHFSRAFYREFGVMPTAFLHSHAPNFKVRIKR